MIPRHNGVPTISESFALNLIISERNNYLLYYNANLKTSFFLFSVKLIEYIFSAVSVWSNTYVGPLPRIKIFFFYYQYPEMNSYLLQRLLHFHQLHCLLKKNIFLSDPMPYPEYLYLSISTFFLNVIAPNKQFSGVG